MGMTMTTPPDTDGLSHVDALVQTDEPTAEMIAASEAEATEPAFAALGVSEELSGGSGAMYLREIGNHDLLTAAEEVLLAQRMEAAREATAARLELGPDAAYAEIERLDQIIEDGKRARRHLIES